MILDLLFPNRCLQCNLIIDGQSLFCEDCKYQIPFTHHHFDTNNELFQRTKTLFPAESAFALMNFEQGNIAQKIIHQLKYSDREHYAKHLAKWTCERLHFNEKPNMIVTIPLHPKKEKKRGYNQLHTYAEILSEHYEIPVNHQLLKRKFHGKAQALKDKNHRLEVVNLFSITQEIHHQHILLIDDVFTTGSTMATAAWEILQFPGNRISIVVMALD
ncbi:MAG: ComF family protein [Bacteroidetes bacterium]|nr:ComF family protein [Bacteroidota bacterium]